MNGVERSAALYKHLVWLQIAECTCPFEWGSYGRLYGGSMGKGWLRADTAPNCPHHVPAENATPVGDIRPDGTTQAHRFDYQASHD